MCVCVCVCVHICNMIRLILQRAIVKYSDICWNMYCWHFKEVNCCHCMFYRFLKNAIHLRSYVLVVTKIRILLLENKIW